MFAASLVLWIAMTMRDASRHAESARRAGPPDIRSVGPAASASHPLNARHLVALMALLLPMAIYVYGALRLDWGFNELSAAFLIGGCIAGVIGGLGVEGTVTAYLDGMKALVPAAMLVGVARSISLVLEDGHVVDTILHALATPLEHLPRALSAMLMVPFHAAVHVVVPSVSGQAVLTMPLIVPMTDLLHLPRQVAVLAYQTGAGLTDLVTPTNGALMAILMAAGVPYQRWLTFAISAGLVQVLVGLAAIAYFVTS
jgi:uncharacterized ion transporter superfamily protein YfcC